MNLKRFDYKTPQTPPPESEGWVQVWHGYYRKAESESSKKRACRRLPNTLNEVDLERQLFLNIIHNLKKDHITMFELGAGWGEWSMALAGIIDFKMIPCQAKSYRCLAVEAEPTHCRWTKEHFEKQNIKGITVFGAAYSEDGSCRFTASDEPIASYGQHVSPDGNITVPCFTVDTLMKNYGFETLDILHMDIQGGELEAIWGAKEAIMRNDIRYILIGTHAHDYNKYIKKILETYHYNVIVDIDPATPPYDGFFAPAAFARNFRTYRLFEKDYIPLCDGTLLLERKSK